MTIAVSDDGRWIAAGGSDRFIHLYDASTRAPVRTLAGNESLVLALAFSPDGTRLAAGANDGTARLWDVRSGRLLRTWASDPPALMAVAFSADGTRLVTSSTMGAARLWPLGAERRDAAEVAAVVARKSPFRLTDDGIVEAP